jgi:hypothetical protein
VTPFWPLARLNVSAHRRVLAHQTVTGHLEVSRTSYASPLELALAEIVELVVSRRVRRCCFGLISRKLESESAQSAEQLGEKMKVPNTRAN